MPRAGNGSPPCGRLGQPRIRHSGLRISCMPNSERSLYRWGHLCDSLGHGNRPVLGHRRSLRTARTTTPGSRLFRRSGRSRRYRGRGRVGGRDHRRDFRERGFGSGNALRCIFLWDGVRRFPGSPVRRRSLFPPAVPLAGRRRACRLPFLKAIRRCLFGRRFSLRRLFPLPGRLFRARRRRLKTTGLQQREGRGRDDGHPLARQPSFCLLPGSGRPVGGSIGRRGHGTP